MNHTTEFLNFNVVQKTNWTKYDQFNLVYLNINSLRNKLYDIEEIYTKITEKSLILLP